MRRRQALLAFLVTAFILLGLSTLVLFPGERGDDSPEPSGDPRFHAILTQFPALVGWPQAGHGQAFEAFLRSCERIEAEPAGGTANPVEAIPDDRFVTPFAGTVDAWQAICREARAMASANDRVGNDSARAFFEREFQPVRIQNVYANTRRFDGLFTGYYEPVLPGSRSRTDRFSAPVYGRPDDLVEVDLGQFRPDLAGRRTAGTVTNGRLVPYPDRRTINDQGLADRAPVLGWMTPDDLFFLQIQGSGVIRFSEAPPIRIGYAGQNGHPYTAIGKPLIERGIIAREDMSLQAIRQWLAGAPPVEAQALRELNASYVFFRRLDDLPDPRLGPEGAEGVQLTPGVSLAADRRYHAMGTPVWLEIESPFRNRNEAYRQFMIIQDTGGAIRGPVRGDVFWGQGADAEAIAGAMRSRGTMTVLLPKSVAAQQDWTAP